MIAAFTATFRISGSMCSPLRRRTCWQATAQFCRFAAESRARRRFCSGGGGAFMSSDSALAAAVTAASADAAAALDLGAGVSSGLGGFDLSSFNLAIMPGSSTTPAVAAGAGPGTSPGHDSAGSLGLWPSPAIGAEIITRLQQQLDAALRREEERDKREAAREARAAAREAERDAREAAREREHAVAMAALLAKLAER